ncbi:UBC-like protein [Aulographum hederae CBS 113979]|uniref:UBC-like protein n=1 Tax=Aulographum hederae CBS 113979 TaxID=1176131 RepID=A0A6G1GRX6_9PEZI|nr:UBC-like protein [Aulographum hederae CBS 113979]
MATPAATKRLQREYVNIQKNPPEYINAHPSESNILEWHYVLTGPPNTPYAGGQYWGTLLFPSDYPFAPPAIRMHTPSGRFQPSNRLCLSISDFHPKSFNPAWGISTILVGLLSFMTSEEITTGSVRATDAERKIFAARTRWWNSTSGGSTTHQGTNRPNAHNLRGIGASRAGDGGVKFRAEWPELDEENWKYMKENKINPANGHSIQPSTPSAGSSGANADGDKSCLTGQAVLRRRLPGSAPGINAVVEGRDAGQGFLARHKWKIAVAAVFVYVIVARALGNGES